MFKIFQGFHLVEEHQQAKKEKKKPQKSASKKLLLISIVTIVSLILFNLPTDAFGIDGLTVIQQRVIAIFVFATLMWIFEIVPSWATSVSIIVLLLLFASDSGLKWMCQPEEVGALLSHESIMASFADPVIMLFIGGFVLAIAATKTGLDAQVAKVLLKPFGKQSVNVLLGFLFITGFFSMFVSNTATAALMLTFLAPVFKKLPENGKGRIALAMSIPVAANLGGMATPIGTPPNAIALKYLNDPEGINLGLGFGEWMMFMFPLVIVLLIISWLILRTMFPFSQKTVELTIDGSMKKEPKTYIVIVTFFVTVLLWMTDQLTGINANTVALIPVAVFALTGVIGTRDLEEMNWSVIWMVAGGFALGTALNGSGLADNIMKLIPFGKWSPVLILIISGGICYFLSNLISNSATAALLMPIIAMVCSGMGDKLNAVGGTAAMLISIAIAASSAMILPISTPPNALAFSTNIVKQKDMVKVGIVMGIISLVLGYTTLMLVGNSL